MDDVSHKLGVGQEIVGEEAIRLATELDDEWHCSEGVKYWSDEEKRSYIHRASELAALVLELLKR